MGVLKAAIVNRVILQVLFLGLFCYIFGSIFQQSTHIHNLNVLFVEYDGGAIGDSVRSACEELKGSGFPSLIERSTTEYPQPNIVDRAVCNIKYWGAVYTSSNASNQLSVAFLGGMAASSYDRSNVLTMVWNQARYIIKRAIQQSPIPPLPIL